MLELSDRLSARISNLNLVCTLLILLMHLSYAGAECEFMDCMFMGISFHDITALAVPTFFLISGFLLARHGEDRGWYVSALKKRFHTLVIPYFVLNLLYLPMLLFYHNYLGLGEWEGGRVSFNWYSISRLFGLSWHFHPAAGTLWFVRCLLMFVVLSPILVYVIRRSMPVAVAILVTLFGIVAGVESLQLGKDVGNALYSFFNLRGLFFFAAGIALAYWGRTFVKRLRIASVVLALIIGCTLTTLDMASCIGRGSLVCWMLFIYVLWHVTPTMRLPHWMTASCFALFALHPMIYKVNSVIVGKLGLQELLPQVIVALEALMVTLGLVYLLTFVIRRYCPKLGLMLFGGRC